MTRSSPMAMATAVALTLLGCALPAHAQEVRFAVGRAAPDHELLGSPLSLEAAVGTRTLDWLGWRLGFRYAQDDFTSVGSTCVGLVMPGADCGPELRQESATVRSWFVALPLTRALPWGAVSFVPGLARTTMDSRQEGTESGRTRSADKAAFGVQVGLELQLRPMAGVPLAVHAGAHTSIHPWFTEEIVADGYTPFEESLQVGWLQVGASFFLGSTGRVGG